MRSFPSTGQTDRPRPHSSTVFFRGAGTAVQGFTHVRQTTALSQGHFAHRSTVGMNTRVQSLHSRSRSRPPCPLHQNLTAHPEGAQERSRYVRTPTFAYCTPTHCARAPRPRAGPRAYATQASRGAPCREAGPRTTFRGSLSWPRRRLRLRRGHAALAVAWVFFTRKPRRLEPVRSRLRRRELAGLLSSRRGAAGRMVPGDRGPAARRRL